jgi:hypothetical protein
MRACSFFLLFSRGQQLISRSLNINLVAIDLKGCSWHICMRFLYRQLAGVHDRIEGGDSVQ